MTMTRPAPMRPIFSGKYAKSVHAMQPDAPIHAVATPTEYYANFVDFVRRATPTEKMFFLSAIVKTAEKLGITGGFNIRILTGHSPLGIQKQQDGVPQFTVDLLAIESVPNAAPIVYGYNIENQFTNIIQGKTDDEIILRNKDAMSFHDKYGRTDVHAQVIPTGHYVNFVHFVKLATRQQKMEFLNTVADTAEKLGVSDNFSIKFNIGVGPIGKTTVLHTHCHLQSGESKVR
ncbi:MAG: HIT domain-containing protein [Proteobacteria bacterium]|nr:HIT domain-containing protein [Pseudomonadota bacterium]